MAQAKVQGKAQSKTERPRVALCTSALREKLLEDALAATSRLGFRGVEVWGREPHVGEVYDYNRSRQCRRLCEERHLEIVAFGSYLRFGATRKIQDGVDLLETLQTAHALRAPIVRVWASDVPSASADAKTWHNAVAEAREAAQRCRKLGIILAVEMHDDTLADTADTARRFIDEADCENLRLNYQPAGRDGLGDPLTRLTRVMDYVVHVHAQNYASLAGPNGEGPRRASLPAGMVDFPAVVDCLLSKHYTGWIAVAAAPVEGNHKMESLAADLAFLNGLLGH
jgi:3-dehydroshikimate dehydratase